MSKKIMHAILAEPGKDPEILELPTTGLEHEEAIRDVLEGNYGAIEFFRIQQGISLFILVNDLAAGLGMKANRRFPGTDREQIIFGKAVFIAAYNGENEGQEGTLDMPEEMCQVFIEQIKANFEACAGTEQPRAQDTVYYEHQGEENEKAFRWIETDAPADPGQPITAGRVKFYGKEQQEIMEINGRFFKKLAVYTEKTPVH